VSEPDDAAALSSFLAARDVVCPVCSYNLRGLKSASCPECAARLHLQVGSENLHPGPWFFGVVSFALGLGFDGVVSLMMVAMTIVMWVRHAAPSLGQAWPVIMLLVFLVPLGAACIAGLVVMFRRRTAWRRMTLRRQWGAAAAIFVVTGLIHAAAGVFLLRYFA
jgi:hypothetical protein